MTRISVVIAVHGQLDYTKNCLQSLWADMPDAEVIVVDNASPDDTLAWLHGLDEPNLKVIAFPENRGSSQAYNAGLEMATGEVRGVLNNDTVIHPGGLQRLYTAALHTGISCFAAGVLNPDLSFARHTDQADESHYANACALFARQDVWQEVGLFDAATFPFYCDDSDWSLRARSLGYRWEICSDVLTHFVHKTVLCLPEVLGTHASANQRFQARWRGILFPDHPLRIALVGTWGRKCGLSVYAEHLVEEWLQQGHEVWVLDEEQKVEGLRPGLPGAHYVPCWKPPDPSWPVLQELTKIAPDVCFFSHDWIHIAPGVLQHLAEGCHHLGCAFVVGWHNLVAYRSAAQEMTQWVDGNVVFHPAAPRFLASVGWSPEQVAYIPHGCPRPVSDLPGKKKGGPWRLATYGLMYPSKGLDQTVTALQVARERSGQEITLDIYSSYNAWTEGQYKTHLQAVQNQIQNTGLAPYVNLWAGFPHEDGLLRALEQADFLALLYRPIPHRLSSSAALATAFSVARPIITSAIDHFRGNAAYERGRLAVQDAHEAGEAIAELLRDPAARQSLAMDARDYARSWGYAEMAAAYITFFRACRKRLPSTRTATPLTRPAAPSPAAYVLRDPGLPAAHLGVVIATHHRNDLLRAALASAAGVPVVVVDDASPPPGVLGALPDEGAPVAVLRTEVNQGPSWARNQGVAHLPCEWVQFLDDDDLLLVGWQARLAPYLTDARDVVIGKALIPFERGLRVDGEVYTSQVCMRRSAFLAADGFCELLRWAEERELIERMQRQGARVKHLELPTVIRPGRGGSGKHPGGQSGKDRPFVPKGF